MDVVSVDMKPCMDALVSYLDLFWKGELQLKYPLLN